VNEFVSDDWFGCGRFGHWNNRRTQVEEEWVWVWLGSPAGDAGIGGIELLSRDKLKSIEVGNHCSTTVVVPAARVEAILSHKELLSANYGEGADGGLGPIKSLSKRIEQPLGLRVASGRQSVQGHEAIDEVVDGPDEFLIEQLLHLTHLALELLVLNVQEGRWLRQVCERSNGFVHFGMSLLA
jgi:hypothetical protein